MSKTLNNKWDEVAEHLTSASGIAFDGCHKIYILLDSAQYDQMLSYGYGNGEGDSRLITSMGADADEMLATLKKWYAESCALKFVSAVATVDGDPNEGFIDLISQFDEEPEDDDTERCVDCQIFEAYFNSGRCMGCEDLADEGEDEDEDE